jgi:putative ABC transport system permease protein
VRGALARKLGRDLRRGWRQFFAVFLMALLSALCYIGLEGAWHGLEASLSRFADANALADGWVQARVIGPAQLQEFESLPGVERVEGVKQAWASDLAQDGAYVRLEAAQDTALSRPQVVEGEPIRVGGEGVWLEEKYARAHGVGVGATVNLAIGDRSTELEVLGLVISPDEVYFTGTAALGAPEPDRYGYGYANTGLLDEAPVNLARFTGDAEAVAVAAPEILGGDYLTVQTRATRASVATAFDRVAQIKNLSYLFSGLFILLALLAMFTAIRRLVAMQRQEIAILQALGFARRQIRIHYLAFGLASGGAGTLVGAAAAPGISLFVLETQKAMFSLPAWTIAYTPLSAAVAAGIVAACAVSALFAVARPLRLTPAEGLRQAVGSSRHVAAERVAPVWSRLRVGARWALREAMLHGVRFVMGVTAAVGSMMLLFAGFGVSDSMYDQVEQVFAVERTHEQRLTLNPGADLGALPDGAQLLQETSARVGADVEDVTLTVIGDGDSLHLRSKGRAAPADDGVYATEALAERLGIAPGDTLTLTVPPAEASLSVELAGLIGSSAPQGLFATDAYWERHGLDFTPTAALTPTGQRVGADAETGITQTLDRTAQIANGDWLVKGLESIFWLIRAFAIVLAVVVLYSLGSLAFTERARDYATLSVLGFSKTDIRRLVGTENATMTALGLAIGVPAGYWFLTAYVTMFDTRDTAYYAHINWPSVVAAIFITALAALSTTVLLRRRVRTINPAEALKGTE